MEENMLIKKKKKSNIAKITSLFLIIGLFVMVIGVSYAYFEFYQTGTYSYTINGGKMDVIYSEETGNTIKIDNLYPMSDQDAKEKAIEEGVITSTTKQRMIELEHTRAELNTKLIKEEMKKPKVTKDGLISWLKQFQTMRLETKEQKQRLIDCFVNSVYLYDDKIVIVFNYKDEIKTVSLKEVNCSSIEAVKTLLSYEPLCSEANSVFFGFMLCLQRLFWCGYKLCHLDTKTKKSKSIAINRKIFDLRTLAV